MKRQKHIFSQSTWAAIMLLAAGWGCSHDVVQNKAPDLGWPTDLPQAQGEAKTQKKLVLIDFNGSDWCPPCKVLASKIFASPQFKTYAAANLRLVDADYPHDLVQPPALKAANDALLKKFNIEGFPTVLILDGDGKVLDKMEGSDTTDPVQFIAHLEKVRAQAK